MGTTIKRIAEIAGVSRGTVDRALNRRGRINPEVAERILKIADEMGYVPKHGKLSRKLAEEKGQADVLRIGVVTQLARSSFMLQVNKGIRHAGKELKEKGIEIIVKENETVDEEQQMKAIAELEETGINALAVMPVDCDGIREKINELIDVKNIPVITFNTDIVGTKRCCFVGLDNRQSGRTAAGLMGLMTHGAGKVLVITGSFSNLAGSCRVDGFVEELKYTYPQMELIGVQSSSDQSDEVAKIIVNAMTAYPDLDGIFVASGGQNGVGRAFEQLQIKKRPYVIIYDRTPYNERALREGTVDFLIDQEAYEQGYQALLLLSRLLKHGKAPESEYMYTEISIKTKYNL